MGNRYDRQSFLGPHAQEAIEAVTVGIVGLGGGGSHIVQQLAHVGFKRYVLYDDDIVTETNLNRLIGATSIDATAATPKLHIAKTMILGLQGDAIIQAFGCRWQALPDALRGCHIVFGCVETFQARQELEVHCRRYLSHYIDIGMDVHPDRSIGGQVILSSPGFPCMTCMEFLTEATLGAEQTRYGNAGSHPQVVWPNGILASAAVGFALQLVTQWTGPRRPEPYLVYDGRLGTLTRHLRHSSWPSKCSHFHADDVGAPMLKEL